MAHPVTGAQGLVPASPSNGSASPTVAHIVEALNIIHNRASTNETRFQALRFLESQKEDKSAIQNGYLLAAERNNSPLVRHFGLSLLEHVLKVQSTSLTPSQAGHLRGFVLELARQIEPGDQPYIRNKIVSLWVEIAKRTWGLDWIGMDEALVQLWNGSLLHKEFVLSVLETLSEDIIHHEDTVSSLRGTDLNRALVEICTPAAVYKEMYPEREQHPIELRYGDEGWLLRVSSFLNDCMQNIRTSNHAKVCAVKALATLRSCMAWGIPRAILWSQCVPIILSVFGCDDEDILLAAVEALHSLYGRSNYDVNEFQELVKLIYQTNNLGLLRNLYDWSMVNAEDIHESKYTISKKLSELISYIAGFLEEKDVDFTGTVDLSYLFPFLISIIQHPSLTVSIPVLHSWSRLLVDEKVGQLDIISSVIGPLLEICTQRIIRYETLPEDSTDPVILFLNEDIDTIPERHAFVGNYRRYCSQIIEVIVQKRAEEAIPHLLSRVDFALNNLYSGLPPFDASKFKKHSIPVLRADTQFNVVEATLKGYNKWVETRGKAPQQDEQQRSSLENALETWAIGLMQRNFEDPILKLRVIKLSVDISTKALADKPSFALKVLEHILMTKADDRPEFLAYSDAVKELYSLATYEIRRLAYRYADYFSTFYNVLERKVKEISATSDLDDKPQMELSSLLLIILQRARDIDPFVRQSRLESFLQPIIQAWCDEEIKTVLSSFSGFYHSLGLENVGPYLQARNAQKLDNWSLVNLDEEGRALQKQMNLKFQQLPLRTTKTMLAVSTERLKKNDPAYQIACELWKDSIPVILPTLLQLISHAHAFHNPDNWGGLTPEMRPIVGRILTDRFWQAGISSGSREEFYARITTSKATLEGFASSVRGKIRAVREASYSVLYSMSRLGEHFYRYQELSVPLSQALYNDSSHLSSHQFSVLLNISRCLIDDCPLQYRNHFLPPMLSNLFSQIDKKVTAEWDMIEKRKAGMIDADLTEEMKDESILRQLTYSAVVMVASLLDPQREDQKGTKNVNNAPEQLAQNSLRDFILSSPEILEPVILFCTHTLRMHDTRCCGIITRVIRSFLSHFVRSVDTPTAASIREFVSTEVLKACITSVHEPYFVDMQKDLAQLIASIWILYGATSRTPRSVIMSLPGMTEARVVATEESLMRSTSSRQQKALVLDLLEDLRGVSISEQGRISDPRAERRKAKSIMQARYMTTEMEGQEGGKVNINDGPDLTGIADMFS
ncbi:hypothetical protein VTO42DRAFT_3503 [Malbranchea cinnamomea]